MIHEERIMERRTQRRLKQYAPFILGIGALAVVGIASLAGSAIKRGNAEKEAAAVTEEAALFAQGENGAAGTDGAGTAAGEAGAGGMSGGHAPHHHDDMMDHSRDEFACERECHDHE